MKIKTTTTIIECTADEIRQSNSVADGVLNLLRSVLNGAVPDVTEEEIQEEMAKEEQ